MKYQCDYLIIGSGIAGLNFALQVADYGQVIILTKKELVESNTNYAQGGIAAVLSKKDSLKKHIADTLKAGAYLNNRQAVEIMIRQAPQEIKRLEKLGVGFTHDEEGHLALAQEGGHSQPRIVHARDRTGKEVERGLAWQVRHHANIRIFESSLVIDLLVKNNCCWGAYALQSSLVNVFYAPVTVLATGGLGRVYAVTSNPKIATGDGYAIASRAGVTMKDMEFIQFHPTALNKRGRPHFLVTEAVRGAGGRLLDYRQQRFVNELLPRDIVTRAVWCKLQKGPVYLAIRHRGPEFIKEHFPYIYSQLWWFGVMMDKELIPVIPVAHFACGGAKTDTYGRTNIKGLYALGEIACTGVHGANRLASNSLLECLVFSSRAAKQARKEKRRKMILVRLPKIKLTNDKKIYAQYIKKIQQLMWEKVGIVRKIKRMKEAEKELARISEKVSKFDSLKVSPKLQELKNILTVAQLITKAALARRKSIGCHFVTS